MVRPCGVRALTSKRVLQPLRFSAYGKNGQLERALEIWRDMAARGCERNVITYSSLISACEKSGRWQLALDLFAEMHREGCKPNVVRIISKSLSSVCHIGCPGLGQGSVRVSFRHQKLGNCPPFMSTLASGASALLELPESAPSS